MSEQLGAMSYYECSAVKLTGVSRMFTEIARKAVKQSKPQPKPVKTTTTTPPEEKKQTKSRKRSQDYKGHSTGGCKTQWRRICYITFSLFCWTVVEGEFTTGYLKPMSVSKSPTSITLYRTRLVVLLCHVIRCQSYYERDWSYQRRSLTLPMDCSSFLHHLMILWKFGTQTTVASGYFGTATLLRGIAVHHLLHYIFYSCTSWFS